MVANNRADVTSVKLDDQGVIEIEGLCLHWEENIEKKFLVSVPQIGRFLEKYANGFPVAPSQYSRTIKSLLGKDFQPIKVASVLNTKKVNCLTLKDFRRLLVKIAQRDESLSYLVECLATGEKYDSKKIKKTKKTPKIKKGFIYLFDSGTTLKVGFSSNVKKRLKTLQRWDGELEAIKVVRGTIEQEFKIHLILHKNGDAFGMEWYPSYRKQEIIELLDELTIENS